MNLVELTFVSHCMSRLNSALASLGNRLELSHSRANSSAAHEPACYH
uniref:Uncharacterized protein n=1 Tax=Arundo donax TaxID=35708 RepID=A0A0A8ZZP3_ARUDO